MEQLRNPLFINIPEDMEIDTENLCSCCGNPNKLRKKKGIGEQILIVEQTPVEQNSIELTRASLIDIPDQIFQTESFCFPRNRNGE